MVSEVGLVPKRSVVPLSKAPNPKLLPGHVKAYVCRYTFLSPIFLSSTTAQINICWCSKFQVVWNTKHYSLCVHNINLRYSMMSFTSIPIAKKQANGKCRNNDIMMHILYQSVHKTTIKELD